MKIIYSLSIIILIGIIVLEYLKFLEVKRAEKYLIIQNDSLRFELSKRVFEDSIALPIFQKLIIDNYSLKRDVRYLRAKLKRYETD